MIQSILEFLKKYFQPKTGRKKEYSAWLEKTQNKTIFSYKKSVVQDSSTCIYMYIQEIKGIFYRSAGLLQASPGLGRNLISVLYFFGFLLIFFGLQFSQTIRSEQHVHTRKKIVLRLTFNPWEAR